MSASHGMRHGQPKLPNLFYRESHPPHAFPSLPFPSLTSTMSPTPSPSPSPSPSPLDTHHLLTELDTISTEIPTTIAYLAQAITTLRDIDPARGDVWVRNLAGLGGQYYGRLDVSVSVLSFPLFLVPC